MEKSEPPQKFWGIQPSSDASNEQPLTPQGHLWGVREDDWASLLHLLSLNYEPSLGADKQTFTLSIFSTSRYFRFITAEVELGELKQYIWCDELGIFDAPQCDGGILQAGNIVLYNFAARGACHYLCKESDHSLCEGIKAALNGRRNRVTEKIIQISAETYVKGRQAPLVDLLGRTNRHLLMLDSPNEVESALSELLGGK